jgi:hypothetical protein
MIVKFTDSVAGTAVYINPDYVVSLRPDPADPLKVTQVKLDDSETIRIFGEQTEVAPQAFAHGVRCHTEHPTCNDACNKPRGPS